MQTVTPFDQAAQRGYPEPISIAIAKDAAGKHNPITLCWAMRTSIDPPMFAISIGIQRHSLAALRQAGEFVLALPSAEMAQDAAFHGTKSGRDLDKLTQYGTKTEPAHQIDSVLLVDAVANFECRIVSEHPTGDHVIFVGEVLITHTNTDLTRRRLYSLGNEQMGSVGPT